MSGVVPFALERIQLLAVDVINAAAVASEDEVALVTIKIDAEPFAFETALMATVALPGGCLVVEFVSRDVNVRRFLVVMVLIAPSSAGHATRVVNAESP